MFDINTFRTELRDHLGVDSNDMDNPAVDLLLNRAYWELLDKFPFREKEVSGSFSTVVGTAIYQMPVPYEALRQLSVEDIDSFAHTTIDKMTNFEYENIFVNNPNLSEFGKPQKYYREGANFKFWPTPDKVYLITIKYWTLLADLSDSHTTTGLPRNWDEILLAGATYRGYYKLGDIVRAERLSNLHAKLLNEAVPVESKEERDYHHAGIEVMQNEYDAR